MAEGLLAAEKTRIGFFPKSRKGTTNAVMNSDIGMTLDQVTDAGSGRSDAFAPNKTRIEVTTELTTTSSKDIASAGSSHGSEWCWTVCWR